jgi:hypothetical protein
LQQSFASRTIGVELRHSFTDYNSDGLINVAGKLAPVPLSGVAAAYFASFLLEKGLRTAWLTLWLLWFVIGNTLLATSPVDQMY